MLKMVHIKFHSIWMRIVGEILDYLLNLQYYTFLYSCDVTSFSQKLKLIATKVSKEDFYWVDKGLVSNLI